MVCVALAQLHCLPMRPAQKQGQRSCHRHPARATLQARPEVHHVVVPGGMITELKCCLAAIAMPIQVVKNLPDVLVVSRAKHPSALHELAVLAEMRSTWHFIAATGLFQHGCFHAGVAEICHVVSAAAPMEMSLLECGSGHVGLARKIGHLVPYGQVKMAPWQDTLLRAPEYSEATVEICRFLGLILTWNTYEGPIWVHGLPMW